MEVIITLTDSAIDQIEQIADELKSDGVQIVGMLGMLGQITASCDPASVAKIQTRHDVESVEESRDIQLAPPESDIQ